MRHRGMVTVAGMVIVAVLGVVFAVQAVKGDGSGHAIASDAAQEDPTDEPTAPSTEPEIVPREALPVTEYEVFLSRDPFEPVVVSAPSGDGSTQAPGETPTTSPDGPDGTDPDDTSSPDPDSARTPTPSDDGCVDDGRVVCDGEVVTLIDVYDDGDPGAIFEVDGAAYDVRIGQVFADSYAVRSIDAPCATVLYGDDAFTLCEGEATLK